MLLWMGYGLYLGIMTVSVIIFCNQSWMGMNTQTRFRHDMYSTDEPPPQVSKASILNLSSKMIIKDLICTPKLLKGGK